MNTALIVIASIQAILSEWEKLQKGHQDIPTTIANVQKVSDDLTVAIANHNLAADAEERKQYPGG